MKPWVKTITIREEIEAGLNSWGNFHIGPKDELASLDSTFSITIKTNEEKVAMGRFLLELGAKLATPPQPKNPAYNLMKRVQEELERLDGYIAGVAVSRTVKEDVRRYLQDNDPKTKPSR
jgi:hypothetical protein